MTAQSPRPTFIRHYSELEEPAGTGDLYALLAAFGRKLGLACIGVNQESVPRAAALAAACA